MGTEAVSKPNALFPFGQESQSSVGSWAGASTASFTCATTGEVVTPAR